jgi:hypothetical protein
MEIFLSALTGSAYILDDKNQLMYRPLGSGDECFSLDIGDFDYTEPEKLGGEVLNNGILLTDYLKEITKKLIAERSKKSY